MERLLPDPAPTSLREQLDLFDPGARAGAERPYVFTNFALTVDGHATIDGRAGPIGSRTDLELLVGLRAKADAVLVGAGTIRVERYGRLLPSEQARERRVAEGLPADPIAVTVTRSLELPWEAGLFASGAGEVVVFTSSQADPPATETPLTVVRHEDGVNLADAARWLASERGVRALLCEGGPDLHADLLAAGLVDELFVTTAPKLAGGQGPGLIEGLPGTGADVPIPLELRWLLRDGDELFARYAVVR